MITTAATPQPRAAYAGVLPDSVINTPSLHQLLSDYSMDFQEEIQFQNEPHVEPVDFVNQLLLYHIAVENKRLMCLL